MRSDPGRFMRLLHFKSHLCIRNLPKCDHLGMLKVKSKWGGGFHFSENEITDISDGNLCYMSSVFTALVFASISIVLLDIAIFMLS